MFKEWDDLVNSCVQGGESEVATLDCIPAVFANLLSALLVFAGLTALIMFIIGGFRFMNARGDPKRIEGARNSFVFGIIGLAIVIFSFLLINLISTVTNVPCIKTFGFGC
ncbi:MAG: hypothetical protein A3B47_04260 [Candidatus Levybacteria bacterium RIFCSPLOWO2_01_FULL_39_24]|nr:MAG: hypothetical protein A2800_04550 [Candidatus Levybacteria bacterium RIFCSPHIGHO2_01_FULL_40_16]OGH28904.1 MAG: hypothetical protein A3E12_04080 [Candidatus Levybacteria bacterium RIFCSPHIGHO2_12_FULL_39_9]OGH45880.1 MAG: hypothetical protein A3B47_04260 [Candidatus Levybacteria bacterium RIFCSPLOWO2_01_FULL_39_24]